MKRILRLFSKVPSTVEMDALQEHVLERGAIAIDKVKSVTQQLRNGYAGTRLSLVGLNDRKLDATEENPIQSGI